MMTLWWVDLRGHGIWIQPVNFGTEYVNRHSTVLANICEIQQPPGEPLDFPFIGAAGMKVNNVAPLDTGEVDLQVEVDWDQDLNFRIRFAIWT